VVAVPDICDAARGALPRICLFLHECLNVCAGATILVVVTPHQFIGKQLPLLKTVIAPSCHAISLIKVPSVL
jgi:glycerol-3-phosphate dehydrogenase